MLGFIILKVIEEVSHDLFLPFALINLIIFRKRIKSVVLERSETVRATGAAIIVQANGWRALDELGIGSTLRETAIQIHR